MRKTLSDRGQVTIPKALRDRLGMRPGAELEFEAEDGRIIVTKAEDADSLTSVFGVLGDGRRTDDFIESIRGEADVPDP